MKKIMICLVIILMGVTGSAYANYQNTAEGTTITSAGSSATISYTLGGVTSSAVSATDASAVVSLNGGIKMTGSTWTDLPNTNNIQPGVGAAYTFSVINSGNFTESVAAAILSKTGEFTGAWTSALSHSSISISREGVSTSITLYVTADAAAIDGAEGGLSVSLNGTKAGALYAAYTGDNTYTYGASGNILTALVFQIVAPSISITKSITVQAPASYVSAGGNATDPVPGATLEYVLTYQNNGSTTANSVEIVDLIPSDTEYKSAAGGTSREWDFGAGWSAVAPASPVDDTVQKVKWVLGNLAVNANGSVTLNVVIE